MVFDEIQIQRSRHTPGLPAQVFPEDCNLVAKEVRYL